MPFLNSIINFFGTKSSRDFKKLSPFAEKINKKYNLLKDLSHDELRDKTTHFKTTNLFSSDRKHYTKLLISDSNFKKNV